MWCLVLVIKIQGSFFEQCMVPLILCWLGDDDVLNPASELYLLWVFSETLLRICRDMYLTQDRHWAFELPTHYVTQHSS
jgi:hypothetical protein